jgi:hypothetical protein
VGALIGVWIGQFAIVNSGKSIQGQKSAGYLALKLRFRSKIWRPLLDRDHGQPPELLVPIECGRLESAERGRIGKYQRISFFKP